MPQIVVEVSTKDARVLKFYFPLEDKEESGERTLKVMESFAFPDEDKQVFAFSHKMANMEIDGWTIFIDLNEYDRMGIDYQNEVNFVSIVRIRHSDFSQTM